MAKPEELENLLAAFRIRADQSSDDESLDDDDVDDVGGSAILKRFGPAIAKLPKKLSGCAYLLINHDETSKPFESSWRATPDALEKQNAKRAAMQQQFEKLNASDRKKVLAVFMPQCAPWLESAWQWLKTQPYQASYSRKAFRAPHHPAVSLNRRIDWLTTFIGQIVPYKPEAVTVPWLAQWAQHAFRYQSECVVPVLVAAIDDQSKEGAEAFDILIKTVTRENAIGIMGDHVIQTLLAASREEGWILMEKTLLAAQRQEGLRQSIVESIDCAHPRAFVRMVRLIVDKDLLRFSSVARAVDVWLGLAWDSASTRVIKENVDAILRFLESPAERAKALKSSEGETVYRALWTYAFEDAVATISICKNLLRSKSDEARFAAVWLLTQLRLKEAAQAKTVALHDPNLQVAMMAATSTDGIALSEEAREAIDGDGSEDDAEPDAAPATFEALEKLYQRLPEKPQTLKPIIWPWTERKVERSMVAAALLRELGELPPTRILPYMKGLDTWAQRDIIKQLAAQKKWDALTRSTLFDLVGHPSADVRGAALEALQKQKLKPEEWLTIEGYLSRTAADLRKGCIQMILKANDAEALASANRLSASGDRCRRLAGLEIYRQLAEANRCRQTCQEQAKQYRAQQKKLTKDEESQLAAIDCSDREVISLQNGLGLFDPQGRSPVVPPKKKKVTLITKAAIACIESLDALVLEHRATPVKVKTYRGLEDQLLGQVHAYYLPKFDPKKPSATQWAKFPLAEIWDQWKASRPAALKDKDGLELLRAVQIAGLIENYRFSSIRTWMKEPNNAKLAKEVVGELSLSATKQLQLVQKILEWLFYLEIPGGTLDYLLDCTENSFASLPEEVILTAIPAPETKKESRRSYWDDEDDKDWRSNSLLTLWYDAVHHYLHATQAKTTPAQNERLWRLERFHDEPCPGAARQRQDFEQYALAFETKLANRNDVLDVLIGPPSGEYGRFSELNRATSRPLSKTFQAICDRNQTLAAMIDEVRERIFDVELSRGEAPTAATEPALSLGSLVGMDKLFRTMEALDKGKLRIERGYNSDSGQSRTATFTHLMKISYPAENDTHAEFKKRVKEATTAGYCNDARLLELAFLAPQWTKHVEATLGWDGFSEGLYWFLAHMSTWGTGGTDAAAEAEGLEASEEVDEFDEEADGQPSDGEPSDDEASTDSIAKPKRLSAWERLILERTPLTAQERYEGAVDVAWFHRIWAILGEKRFKQMAEAARYASNSAQAKKAQFLADVLTGKTTRKELADGIEKKKLKEYVRLLGLMPLAGGAKREADIVERYKTLIGYKKYARGLSALTKPQALRAVEIGMQNLARQAGYQDPLRMEWALEAESLKDLVAGPVSVTREGVTLTLQIDENAKPLVTLRKGDKPIKSVPAPLKKKHAEIAELVDRAAELRRSANRIKQSLEAAMCRGDTITASELVQLANHAILAPQLSRLVLIGDGIAGYPDKGGKVLRDHSGKLEPIKKSELLRIAHPSDLLALGNWDKWQHDCFSAERVQPFKQIFRELYVITKQEKKDQTSTQRFAGQQISPRQAMALWNSRGWSTQDEVVKIFHDLSLIAEVTFQYTYGTAAEIEGLTIERVQFRKRDSFEPLKLVAVPPIVFSEVMRDMDLVVSVAHRGEVDPEASASTVEMRTALLRETAQLLGLQNVSFKPSHAVIKGYYGDYSVHLGSGMAHRLPGGALAILPVHAQHRGRLFLPFADDDPRTAEIISKVLLLSRDEEIQDPRILDQIGAPIGKRRAVITEPNEAAKTGSSKPTKAKATVGATSGAAGGDASMSSKRSFEFSEGTSSKFWQIEISGSTVTTSWGRIGSAGQTKTKTFGDPQKAQAEFEKLVSEKSSKGYKEA